jgi:hypothetical protein
LEPIWFKLGAYRSERTYIAVTGSRSLASSSTSCLERCRYAAAVARRGGRTAPQSPKHEDIFGILMLSPLSLPGHRTLESLRGRRKKQRSNTSSVGVICWGSADSGVKWREYD